MVSSMNGSCETCRYAKLTIDVSNTLEQELQVVGCYRYPLTVWIHGEDAHEHWCGEYEKKVIPNLNPGGLNMVKKR